MAKSRIEAASGGEGERVERGKVVVGVADGLADAAGGDGLQTVWVLETLSHLGPVGAPDGAGEALDDLDEEQGVVGRQGWEVELGMGFAFHQETSERAAWTWSAEAAWTLARAAAIKV